MKKIIIILLLLIPLIVVLTITASGLIISAEVSIEIESFELWHKGERVTEATINLGDYQRKNLRYQLIPRYYPGVANVSGFKWSSDNPTVASVDSDGIVTFHECGFAKITAVSMDHISIRASCSFFVEDDKIHSLSFNDGSESFDTLSMSVYDAKQLRVEIMPYSAFVGDLEWSTGDESVVTVSSNGVIKAKKEGKADIRVRAKGKSGDTVETILPVTVSGVSDLKCTDLYLYGDGQVDLTEYLSSGSLVGGNEISLAEIALGDSKEYRVEGRDSVITVHRLSSLKMLGIADYDLMLKGEWKDGVFLGAGRSILLTPIDLATSAPVEGVQVSVSNGEILAVNGNKISAKSAGKATVTFSKEGYEAFHLEINVAIPVSYFALNVDAENDIVGLGSERVYGTKSMYDGYIVDGIRITPESVYPTTGSRSLFSYSVKEDYASIDENGMLLFKDEAVGKEVTVIVRSLFSTNNLSRTYTFRHIVKGVNVGFGYGDNTFNAEKGEKPSFDPYYDALLVMSEDRNEALVFQTNLYMPTRETLAKYKGPYGKIQLNRDIYGNGYKLDGQFYQYDYESHVFEGTDDSQVEAWQKGITVVDLFINSYAPVGDDSKATFEALMQKGGEPIRSFFKKRTDFSISFRYCVFQYAYSHACLIGGTFVFDGCIFRNNAGVALMIQSLHGQENYVTVNNCIFSNSISMTATLSNGDFPAKAGQEVLYNELRWTGNNYIYNWKKVDEIRLDIIPRGVMKNAALDAVLESLNDKLSECARLSFDRGMNDALVLTKDKEKYVNVGVFFMGFWAPVNPIVNEDREKLTDGTHVIVDTKTSTLKELYLNSGPLGAVKSFAADLLDFDAPCYMLSNLDNDGNYNTAPGETYKLNEKTYAMLRGQGK